MNSGLSNDDFKIKKVKLNQQLVNQLIIQFVISRNEAFEVVEDRRFQNLINALAPQFKIMSSRNLSTTCLNQEFSTIFKKINQIIKSVQFDTFSLCMDIWFCKPKNRSFLAFNMIFNGLNQNIQVLLSFFELDQPHNSDHIKLALNSVLNQFQLNDKKIIFCTDEGRNLVKTLEKEKRLSCIAHIYHNFTKDLKSSDKILEHLINKCKKIVHFFYFKNILVQDYVLNKEKYESEQIEEFFSEISQINNEINFEENEFLSFDQLEQEINPTKLHNFTVTRWCSIYMMFNSILKNKEYVISIISHCIENKLLFETEEWTQLEQYTRLFELFKKITDELSKRDQMCLNKVMLYRYHTIQKLKTFKFDDKQKQAKELRMKIIRLFEDRFPIDDLYILGSLVDPFNKNLVPVNEYLEQIEKSKKDFLIDCAATFCNLVYEPTIGSNDDGKKSDDILLAEMYSNNLDESDSFRDEFRKFFEIRISELNVQNVDEF